MGIPAADQVHLFERFFRATNATNIQGTGLGLHIVGRYVEILNGIISYQSELEKGSTFTIVIPTKIKNDFD
jgi:signal transduction histidine kinase